FLTVKSYTCARLYLIRQIFNIDVLCITQFLAAIILSFYFLLIRPAPRSTLFPYTTLFRSRHRKPRGQWQNAGNSQQKPSRGGGRDRKSTRLNSSHVEISYAVFCLKKKNKRDRRVGHRARRRARRAGRIDAPTISQQPDRSG